MYVLPKKIKYLYFFLFSVPLAAGIGRRGRRDTQNTVASDLNVDPLFDAIAAVDVADCGKLLVCHLTARAENELNNEEKMVVDLFKNFNGKIDPLHSQAQYMLAAQIGNYKKPDICQTQYIKCPYRTNQLSGLLKQNQ